MKKKPPWTVAEYRKRTIAERERKNTILSQKLKRRRSNAGVKKGLAEKRRKRFIQSEKAKAKREKQLIIPIDEQKPLTSELKRILSRKHSNGKSVALRVVHAMVKASERGDVQAAKLIFERVEGKVPQAVTVSTAPAFSVKPPPKPENVIDVTASSETAISEGE